MERKSNLSFGEKRTSQKGMFSVILGIISLVAGIVLVIISGLSYGKAGTAVGACGIVAVVTSITGIVFSILGAIEQDTLKASVYTGFLMNIVITVAWACLYVIGL